MTAAPQQGQPATISACCRAAPALVAVGAVESGQCDIGMLSRRIRSDDAERFSKLGDLRLRGSENVIAMDGIAIIVNLPVVYDSITEGNMLYVVMEFVEGDNLKQQVRELWS